MRIILNGDNCKVTANTLDKILLELGYKTETIAAALNGTFIHKQDRTATTLEEGDQLEVVAPMQGG